MGVLWVKYSLGSSVPYDVCHCEALMHSFKETGV